MGIGLLEQMIEYCDQMYSDYHCNECTAHNCTLNCKDCLDDIHYHRNEIRSEYNCKKLLYYYLCRYSYKYCSEIIYALERVDLERYPYFNILSLGCGGAADLMAFDYYSESDEDIFYHGVDINTYWNDIHSKITELYPHASFTTGFDVKCDISTLNNKRYNIVIIEYLISYLYSRGSSVVTDLFDDLIQYIVANKPQNSPMLLIINDADSIKTGRDEFIKLVQKLDKKGYKATFEPMRFKDHQHYPYSEMYPSKNLLFNCSWDFQQEYCVPLSCESAQMIIEIE